MVHECEKSTDRKRKRKKVQNHMEISALEFTFKQRQRKTPNRVLDQQQTKPQRKRK